MCYVFVKRLLSSVFNNEYFLLNMKDANWYDKFNRVWFVSMNQIDIKT